MIPAHVVVEPKSVTTQQFPHPNHILKILRETAVLRNMSVGRLAGMAAMMVIERARAWDTALKKHAQGPYATKTLLAKIFYHLM